MIGTLYRLDFASGKSYVGLTAQKLTDRVKGHRHDALRRNSRLPVHQAWRVHGEPRVVALAVMPRADLPECEIRAIKVFGTLKPNGYNLSPGGEIPPAWIPGVPEKISAAAKGRIVSAAHRQAMSEGVRRAYTDPALRERMSEARKGHPVPEETRAKMRAAMTGRTLSPEHKEKLKAARGRRPPASEETRAKMSESHRAFQAKKRKTLA